MEIYIFEFCPCSYESVFGAISFHFTYTDAYQAMRKHKLEQYSEWLEAQRICGKRPGDKYPSWILHRVRKGIVT